ILLTPKRFLRTASLAVRIACALALVTILGSSFSIPRLLLSANPPDYTRYLPPVWFLDLHQSIIGRGSPFSGSPTFAVEITSGMLVFALGIYALTYYRQFTRIPEETAV